MSICYSNMASKLQQEYCDTHQLPMFAPATGWCPKCSKNIYMPQTHYGKDGTVLITGVTLTEAVTSLITCCPHCNYSFCD